METDVRTAFNNVVARYKAMDAQRVYVTCPQCGEQREDTPWECLGCWRARMQPVWDMQQAEQCQRDLDTRRHGLTVKTVRDLLARYQDDAVVMFVDDEQWNIVSGLEDSSAVFGGLPTVSIVKP